MMTREQLHKHEVRYGTYLIPSVTNVVLNLIDGDAEALRQGYAGRTDRQGVRSSVVQSLHGGLGILRGSEIAHGTRIRESGGLWTHIENGAFLPYRIQTQAAESANDISGANAAGLVVHQVSSTLGQSKRREYFGVGTKFKRQKSDSDHEIETTGLSLTNNICCMGEGVINNTRYIVCGTDGNTDDVFGIADPTLSPPVATPLFALSSGDWVGGFWFMPNLGPGFNFFYGKIGGVVGLWWLPANKALLTAPEPLVLTSTRDIMGSLPTTTWSEQDPVSGGNEGFVSDRFDRGSSTFVSNDGVWLNAGNILSNNGSNATFQVKGKDSDFFNDPTPGVSSWLHAFYNAGATIPLSHIMTGAEVTVDCEESNAGANARIAEIQLLVNGSQVGQPKGGSGELSTSDGDIVFGGSTDTWSAIVSGDDVKSLGVRLRMSYSVDAETAPPTYTIGVDHIGLTLTTRPLGTQAKIPVGGTCFGVDPLDPFTVYIRAPEFQDEIGSINVPRVLFKLVMAYDSAGDRPSVTVSKPAIGMGHIECGNYTAGGLLVFGDTSAGLAKIGKLLLSDRTPTEVGFNSRDQGYTESWGVTGVIPCDQGAILKCVTEDGLVMQDWIWNAQNLSLHAFAPRETITSAPLRYARQYVGHELRRRYTFFASTTNTSVSRTFQPRNVFENPLSNNTAEIKANGVITVRLPDLDALGAPERNKVLLVAWFLGREVSASNTVRLRYSIDGGQTMTTWTTFTAFGTKATLSVPVSFRYLMLEVGLDHTTDSAGTPNGLGPILIEGYSGPRKLRQAVITFDPNDEEFVRTYEGGQPQLMSLLVTQENTSPVQTFRYGPTTFLAEIPGAQGVVRPNEIGQRNEPIPQKPGTLTLLEVAQ